MGYPQALEALLAASDVPRRIWWRDDDAGRSDPQLERLLDLSRRHRVPVAVAVVPRWLQAPVADRLQHCPTVTVLQHGIEHQDRAAVGGRKVELGGTASAADLEEGVLAGRVALARAFGPGFLPVMVPPWNRMDQAVADALPAWGFTGTSGWRGSSFNCPPGLHRLDTHIDAIRWRPTRCCLDADRLIAELATAMAADAVAPVGLLTHHLATDAAGWRGLDRFIGLVQDHPRLAFASAAELLLEAP